MFAIIHSLYYDIIMAGFESSYAHAFELAKNKEYTEAIAKYNEALEAVPTGSIDDARIRRDLGFTYALQSLDTLKHKDTSHGIAPGSLFGDAQAMLASSLAITENLLAPPCYDIQHFYAEHGATLSLMGRLATIASLNIPNTDTKDALPVNYYYNAHDFLKVGDNMYYFVSNALVAARSDRIRGNLTASLGWVGKAVIGLARSVLEDRANAKASFRTFVRRVPSIRTKNAALRSVRTQP